MNWDAIGAVGEIIGAIAVVVTLVYLATQIRVSNIASKQAAMREMQDLSAQFVSILTSSTENARIWTKGSMDDEDLSAYERVQYRAMLLQCNNIWERMYRAQSTGEMDDWYWTTSLNNLRRIVSSRGYKSWHKDMRPTFNTDWCEFVETQMEYETGDYAPQGLRGLVSNDQE